MPVQMLRAGLCLSAASFLLAACTGGYTTRIIDTPETRHLKGHQRPYSVNGRRYSPLASPEGFSERGIASWYGRDFHGKKTSNGEIYDMNALTGAHKTLPMGTKVRVINESNGREVEVRINDRGPFIRGRVIDVSYAAAKRLGLVGPGTARVRIEAFGPAPISGSLGGSGLGGDYAVQVGSFTRRENAQRLAARLEEQAGASTSVHREHVGDTLYFRVMAGRYKTLNDAERAKAGFEKEGFANCFVVARE